MSNGPLIWLTRPREDSEKLSAQLSQQGIDSIVAPVMRIAYEPAPVQLPAMPDAILVTSRHAAPMLENLPATWRTLPVFCVGAATGAKALQAGYRNIVHGEMGVLDLLPHMTETLKVNARVLYLAGADTRVDVRALLAAKHLQVETLLAYNADAETVLAPAVIDALNAHRLNAVAFFSPRSAQVAATLLANRNIEQMEAYCLSLAVAEAAGALNWKHIHACHTPTLEAMVHLVVSRSAAKVL